MKKVARLQKESDNGLSAKYYRIRGKMKLPRYFKTEQDVQSTIDSSVTPWPAKVRAIPETEPIANVKKNAPDSWARTPTLEEHLGGAAEPREGLAAVFGSDRVGQAEGIAHDSGKGATMPRTSDNKCYHEEAVSQPRMARVTTRRRAQSSRGSLWQGLWGSSRFLHSGAPCWPP